MQYRDSSRKDISSSAEEAISTGVGEVSFLDEIMYGHKYTYVYSCVYMYTRKFLFRVQTSPESKAQSSLESTVDKEMTVGTRRTS